ncbi:MAG: precorrin-6y C5,15-methyltransferase (decarboxylating) subunit CbiE [Elainellaceae cyanobacterium]
MTTPIHVVGIGLDGAAGLSQDVYQIVEQAKLLIGSDRHLQYFPNHPAETLILNDFQHTIQTIRQHLSSHSATVDFPSIVILASGDPLFFGIGRLLIAEFPLECLTFHPHVSSIQLAFSRIKVPWQDAQIMSAHGRSLEPLIHLLQRGVDKIAVLTDFTNTPSAIARLIVGLELPNSYTIWVCENLEGELETVQNFTAHEMLDQTFSPLNIVILLCTSHSDQTFQASSMLPQLGLPDSSFNSFGDRPGLMTKREVRVLALGELALKNPQVVWDIGAGTGSVSIEIARLCADSEIYAVEKTSAGITLIQQNIQRFQTKNLISVHGLAPDILRDLPNPDRIFVGGSSGKLTSILQICQSRLAHGGILVVALATLESLSESLDWIKTEALDRQGWEHRFLQAQLSRSIPVGSLTRWTPLNPVTFMTLTKPPEH